MRFKELRLGQFFSDNNDEVLVKFVFNHLKPGGPRPVAQPTHAMGWPYTVFLEA
jgi:hypothetical protein